MHSEIVEFDFFDKNSKSFMSIIIFSYFFKDIYLIRSHICTQTQGPSLIHWNLKTTNGWSRSVGRSHGFYPRMKCNRTQNKCLGLGHWGHKYNTFLWIENSPVATRNAGHLPDKYYYSSVVWFDHWRGLVCIWPWCLWSTGALQLGARSPTCFCLCPIYIYMDLIRSYIYRYGIMDNANME